MPIRRRPILRTAAVAATATAVSKGVSNKMDEKEAAKEQAAAGQSVQQEVAQAPAAPAAEPQTNSTGDELIEQLSKLASLKDAGVLTDEEFAAAKAKLLG